MKWLVLAVLAVGLVASQSTAQQSAPVADIPTNEFNLAIEPDVLKDVSEPADSTIEAIKPKSGYAAAHALGEERGKLVVFVGAKWCGPCKAFEPVFRKVVENLGDTAAVVELDVDRDAATAGEMLAIANRTGIPCVLVFAKVDGEWTLTLPQCNESALRAAITKPNGQASFAAECVGCNSCPRDCAANGCGCSMSAASSSGGDHGGVQLVRGQPVRNLAKVSAVGVAKVVKAVAWRLYHPFNSRFCNRCR